MQPFTHICAILTTASRVCAALCGLAIKFGQFKSGSSGLGGSLQYTSVPAPAITPALSAATRSFSLTAAAIDDKRRGLHHRKLPRRDHVPRLLSERHMDGDDVRRAQQIFIVLIRLRAQRFNLLAA